VIDVGLVMSDVQQRRNEKFRPRLEQMLDDLLALRNLRSEDRAAVQLDQQSVGRLSRMDAIQAQQMALAADRQRLVQISRIRRALSQMDQGEFGYCAECGNEIPDGRLEADPSTHLCVGCASRRSK
jgi:DnaK suppressor protein